MSTSCPHCGAAMDDGSRFCSVCGRPIPAMQEEATVFVLKPGTACLEETDECISPPAASPPALSQREKRIARKLRHMAFEESASEDYIDPITPPRQRWKIRLISLLVAAAVLSALVGALFVHQTVEQAAFTPIEAAYESLAQGSPAALQAALYPDLCRTLEDLGYFRSDGSW